MRGVNAIEPMSVFALNLIIGLGLGLAIDYSLFIVSRFREELEHGRGDRRRARRRRCARPGAPCSSAPPPSPRRSPSLLVFEQRFLFSMGVGGILVTLVAAAVSLTILPALLAALGPRVERARAGALARGDATRGRRARSPASGTGSRAG